MYIYCNELFFKINNYLSCFFSELIPLAETEEAKKKVQHDQLI